MRSFGGNEKSRKSIANFLFQHTMRRYVWVRERVALNRELINELRYICNKLSTEESHMLWMGNKLTLN